MFSGIAMENSYAETERRLSEILGAATHIAPDADFKEAHGYIDDQGEYALAPTRLPQR
jgi:hypothetical protein